MIKLRSTPVNDVDSMLCDDTLLSAPQRITAYVSILEQNPAIDLSEATTIELIHAFMQAEKPNLAVLESLAQEAYKRNNLAVLSEAFKRLKSQSFQDRVLLITRQEKPHWYAHLLEMLPEEKRTTFINSLAGFGL